LNKISAILFPPAWNWMDSISSSLRPRVCCKTSTDLMGREADGEEKPFVVSTWVFINNFTAYSFPPELRRYLSQCECPVISGSQPLLCIGAAHQIMRKSSQHHHPDVNHHAQLLKNISPHASDSFASTLPHLRQKILYSSWIK